jgi:hypothetical protein
MQYEEAREPGGVAVTVALLYGSPYERRVPVATVHVTSADPVRVDALEVFGVRPVAFSLVPLPPADLYIPSVTTPSSSLEVSVETVTEPVPAYLATIVNHGSRDVMMLDFTAWRGPRQAGTGRSRKAGRMPVVPAGGSYVLKVNATASQGAGPSGWMALDRIEITSVLWSDDIVEGDGKPAADEHALDAGTALQLDRMLVLLRAAGRDPAAHGLADLRTRIAALTLAVTREEAEAAAAAIPGSVRLPVETVNRTMAAGMRNARSAVLNDIDELLKASSAPGAAEYAAWLSRVTAKYAEWRGRITP